MPEPKPDNQKYKLARQMGLAITIPMVLASGPLIGWFIGTWLDKKLGTTPWIFIILLILGVVASVRETIKIIKEISDEDSD